MFAVKQASNSESLPNPPITPLDIYRLITFTYENDTPEWTYPLSIYNQDKVKWMRRVAMDFLENAKRYVLNKSIPRREVLSPGQVILVREYKRRGDEEVLEVVKGFNEVDVDRLGFTYETYWMTFPDFGFAEVDYDVLLWSDECRS